MRYDFNTSGTLLTIKRGGIHLGTWDVQAQGDSDISLRFSEEKIYVELSDNGYRLGVIKSTDTVFINDTEETGTMTEKFTAIKAVAFTAPSSGGSATLKVSLTAAEIKTLNSLPFELLPAPGAGKMNKIIDAVAVYTHGTELFEGGYDIYIVEEDALLDINPSGLYQLAFLNLLSDSQNKNKIGLSPATEAAVIPLITENKKVYVYMAGDSIGGDGTIDIYISYRIITL